MQVHKPMFRRGRLTEALLFVLALTLYVICFYHQALTNIQKNLRSAHSVFLRVCYGSQNKQRSFPYTTLSDC